MEQSEEILKAIQSANDGVWFPIATITFILSVLILLLLYIWKQSQKTNDKRHLDNERMITELSKSSLKLSNLLIKIESNQEHQQKEIDKLTA